MWTCIPVLNFDAKDKFLRLYHTSQGDEYNSSRSGSVDKYNYSNCVSSVLAQYRGPNVDEFRVCCDLDNAYSSHIDGWIEFALSNRVHTIELSLSIWPQPSCEKSYTLRSLESNMFVGFNSLKNLSLKAVNVDDEAIEYFLSDCPLLERLFLHGNHALRNLKVVGSSLMLRYLEVEGCRFLDTVEICDTNLVSFTYVGKEPKTMILKKAPQLVEVSIDPCGSMLCARAMFSKLSCCFSQLRILRMSFWHFEQVSF